MKTSLFVLVSLFASTIALADGMPPGVLGMPVMNPCMDSQADAAAKASADKFDAFFKEMSAKRKAPVPRERASSPVVGVCNAGNLRNAAGVIVMGIIADRNVCGVNYYFSTDADKTTFAKWAYKALGSGKVSIESALCVNVHHAAPRLGMPIIRH